MRDNNLYHTNNTLIVFALIMSSIFSLITFFVTKDIMQYLAVQNNAGHYNMKDASFTWGPAPELKP